jgi:hypothetical protein
MKAGDGVGNKYGTEPPGPQAIERIQALLARRIDGLVAVEVRTLCHLGADHLSLGIQQLDRPAVQPRLVGIAHAVAV